MFCPRCSHQQISDYALFCSKCGFKLSAVKELVANDGLPLAVATDAIPLPNQVSISIGHRKLNIIYIVVFLAILIPVALNFRHSPEFFGRIQSAFIFVVILMTILYRWVIGRPVPNQLSGQYRKLRIIFFIVVAALPLSIVLKDLPYPGVSFPVIVLGVCLLAMVFRRLIGMGTFLTPEHSSLKSAESVGSALPEPQSTPVQNYDRVLNNTTEMVPVPGVTGDITSPLKDQSHN